MSGSAAQSSPRPSEPAQAPPPERLAWIDATAGVAGDMLLGALVDAGADLHAVQHVIDALIPASVRFTSRTVDRGSQRALKVDVDVLVENPPHRTWASIRTMLEDARTDPAVPPRTIDLALEVFSRLAVAEGFAHGIDPEQVHFHEVGALDSLADVIGACEAWRQLGITRGAASVIAVGSGRIRAAHGDIPVPVPAVARLAEGWPTVAGDMLPARVHGHGHGHGHAHGGAEGHGHSHDHSHPGDPAPEHEHEYAGEHAHDHAHPHSHGHPDPSGDHHAHTHAHHPEDDLPAHVVGGPHAAPGRPVPPGVAPGIGELATPTGVALVRGLASTAGSQPAMVTERIGIGAGTKDTPGRPNVVRVIIGEPWAGGPATVASAAASPGHPSPPTDAHDTPARAVQLEANVDDLDPRLWPGVLDALLAQGALDAWLTPIVMKHGRPAVTVHTLVREADVDARAEQIMQLTGSLGVRWSPVERRIRTRSFDRIELDGHPVEVKVARDADGAVVRREPEFRDVARAAAHLGISEREALDRTRRLAVQDG